MLQIRSLRLKIILVFSGFSFLLGFAILLAILISTQYTETYTLKKNLENEADRYVTSIVSSPVSPVSISYEAPIPRSHYMTTYIGEDLLPEWAQKEFSSADEGEYTKEHDKQLYYVSIRELPDGQKFYMFYNVTTIISNHENMEITRKYFMIILLPTFLVGLILGIITAFKAVSPVMRLSSIVKAGKETGHYPENFSESFQNQEIHILAETLENAISEMQSSISREKAFARDASHELRTPVAIINGAVQLLSKDIEDNESKNAKILARINRATKTMEHLINSFLWLSWHEKQDSEEYCDASVVVKDVVENFNYLLVNKDIEIIVEEHEASILTVSPPILSILISNLLRNALSYTVEGHVLISIYRGCISVSDTGPGFSDSVLNNLNREKGVFKADGFGFGLSIVHRICSHIGWRLKIESVENKGARVVICYGIKDGSNVCPRVCNDSRR